MYKNKIVLGEQETPVLSLRKKLVGLDDGLNVYRKLEKDEEEILIPFTVSLFVTSEKSKILLRRYIDDLKKGVCRESLGINFGQMSKTAYWLGKCVKLKRDMEAMGVVPMKVHGFECTVMGFRPETTTDLYRAIEANLMEIADLIKEVDQKLVKAPVALYGNYYRFLRGQYNEEQAVRDFYNWLRTSGIITLVKLRMLRAEKIADFINNGILRLALGSCDIEQDDVDVEQFKKQLPHNYSCVKDFDVLCTVFSRTIGWQGDILIPNYDCAGLFIFQHCNELTEEQINGIFYLDEMLKLIHEEIHVTEGRFFCDIGDVTKEPSLCYIPDVLATPEAMVLWRKAQKAGYVDEHFQPICSRPEAAILAFEMAKRLGIKDKWKAFETLWGRRNMYRDYHTAINQKKSLEYRDKVRAVLG